MNTSFVKPFFSYIVITFIKHIIKMKNVLYLLPVYLILYKNITYKIYNFVYKILVTAMVLNMYRVFKYNGKNLKLQ